MTETQRSPTAGRMDLLPDGGATPSPVVDIIGGTSLGEDIEGDDEVFYEDEEAPCGGRGGTSGPSGSTGGSAEPRGGEGGRNHAGDARGDVPVRGRGTETGLDSEGGGDSLSSVRTDEGGSGPPQDTDAVLQQEPPTAPDPASTPAPEPASTHDLDPVTASTPDPASTPGPEPAIASTPAPASTPGPGQAGQVSSAEEGEQREGVTSPRVQRDITTGGSQVNHQAEVQAPEESQEELDRDRAEPQPSRGFLSTRGTQSLGRRAGHRKSFNHHIHSKYSTVSYRKIRRGNTRQKIEEFESMMMNI